MPSRPNDLFADTSGWAEVVDDTLPFHTRAVSLSDQAVRAGGRLVTTNWVLAEFTALLTSPLRFPKPQQIQLLRNLRADPAVEGVHLDPVLEADAWQLWENRPDKTWSLVDCASFEVMRQRGLTDALTSDHHFDQAGFARLLK